MRKGDALWHALGQGLWFRWHVGLIMIKGCFLCACSCGMSVFMCLTRLLFLCVLCVLCVLCLVPRCLDALCLFFRGLNLLFACAGEVGQGGLCDIDSLRW